MSLKHIFTIIMLFAFYKAFSQSSLNNPEHLAVINSPATLPVDSIEQKDISDIFPKAADRKVSDNRKSPANAIYSFIPSAGYTLSTGFALDLSSNVVFYTSPFHSENSSVVTADIGYDSKSQKVFLTRAEIWTVDNEYKIISDLRWEKFPVNTYGLGTYTTFATNSNLDFNYMRIYGTILKKIAPDYYAGLGYDLDYHYNINATGSPNNPVSDFMKYGQTSRSASSGINFNFLFDSRKNPLNPLAGGYASISYRENSKFLGSDAGWRSLQFDLRKYIKLSSKSNNVLAIWSILSFTNGNAPYLDLPSTGNDMYNNSGRGYAIGRYRGSNMLYLECEYRFGITTNGLIGGVVFANGESFSEYRSNTFETVAPAAGAGLRIKLNKHSNTNICIDYGVGIKGSRGFFVNLGEVF